VHRGPLLAMLVVAMFVVWCYEMVMHEAFRRIVDLTGLIRLPGLCGVAWTIVRI
jgi:hypothetical protein